MLSRIYHKQLILENKKLNKTELNQKMNMNDLQKYIQENNKYILISLKDFLKKFCFMKIITDYNIKIEDINYPFKDSSIENILSIINIEYLVELLPKNGFSFNDIITLLPKGFKASDIFYELFLSNYDFNKVLNSLFENMKINNNEKNNEISKELIIQFSPIKFNFVQLDKNIFDFIEKITKKECSECKNKEKHSFICLICGEKICYPNKFDLSEILSHTRKCTTDYNIYIYTKNMKLYYFDTNRNLLKLKPLYVNKAGIGPKKGKMTKEYELSHENLNSALRNYICKDFNLKLNN